MTDNYKENFWNIMLSWRWCWYVDVCHELEITWSRISSTRIIHSTTTCRSCKYFNLILRSPAQHFYWFKFGKFKISKCLLAWDMCKSEWWRWHPTCKFGSNCNWYTCRTFDYFRPLSCSDHSLKPFLPFSTFTASYHALVWLIIMRISMSHGDFLNSILVGI